MSRVRGNIAMLPDTTQDRIPLLVERSAPDLDRPRLDPGIEKRLDDIERRSAACYASIEDASARYNDLARQIRSKSQKNGAVKVLPPPLPKR